MFKDNWIKRAHEYIHSQNINRLAVEKFETQYANTICDLADVAVQLHRENNSREQIHNTIRQRLEKQHQMSREIIGHYQQTYDHLGQLIDLRHQESIADYHEKFRFLLFRIATAVGIAAVVLGTGWIAQTWGIPLPLLRSLA